MEIGKFLQKQIGVHPLRRLTCFAAKHGPSLPSSWPGCPFTSREFGLGWLPTIRPNFCSLDHSIGHFPDLSCARLETRPMAFVFRSKGATRHSRRPNAARNVRGAMGDLPSERETAAEHGRVCGSRL
jgi:hypothetical protein